MAQDGGEAIGLIAGAVAFVSLSPGAPRLLRRHEEKEDRMT